MNQGKNWTTAYPLINDNFRWSKSSKNHFEPYSQWFEFIKDSAIFKPCVKHRVWKHIRFVKMSTDKLKSRDRFWPIALADFVQWTKLCTLKPFHIKTLYRGHLFCLPRNKQIHILNKNKKSTTFTEVREFEFKKSAGKVLAANKQIISSFIFYW